MNKTYLDIKISANTLMNNVNYKICLVEFDPASTTFCAKKRRLKEDEKLMS